MTSLWKGVKWMLRIFFGVIVLTLVLNIASDYISSWLSGKELRIFEEFIRLCGSYWTFLVLSLPIIGVILFYAWEREKKAEFRRIWELYKPIKKITPEDFKIEKYKKAYIYRNSNITIENLLKNKKHILIIGKPKIGKTRAAYEAIKKLENFSVIKPRPEKIEEIEKIKIPPLSNKNFILFLDDLQRFIGKSVGDLINKLKRESRNLIIVATCRTGKKELGLVERVVEEEKEMLPLYREFTYIDLEEISEEKGRRLAQDVGLPWETVEFDGTPGSVILGLKAMKERYKRAGDGQDILKSLKLLREGNLFVYRELRIKDVCRDIFEWSYEMLRRSNWDRVINNLMEDGFITKDEDIINIYPSYLDECVYDYNPSLRDLMKLKNILIRMGDSGSLFYLGNSFYYKEDFIHAKDCYLEAVKIYPKYASAHSSLGYVLAKIGEVEEGKDNYEKAEKLYNEAEKEHREAININPYYFINHDNLGYVLCRLGEIKEIKGEHTEAKRLYEEAEKEHREAIMINPDHFSPHKNLAYALVKLGRYEEAEKEYREAIRIKPDYPSARNNLGYLLAKLGRWEEAKEEYREAIKASPDYIVAYVKLGHLLAKLGRYEEAEGEYRKALNINPNYVKVHTALGYVLVKLKRYDEAEKEFRKAIEIKPDFVEAHRNLGYLLVILGKDEDKKGRHDEAKKRYDEAEKEYKKALQLNPNDEDTLVCFGILLEWLKRDKEAENCYKRVIEKNPNNIEAHITYGYFLSYRGREEEAIREFDEVIKINPNDFKVRNQLMYLHRELSHIYAHRGRGLIKLGNFDKAEEELRRAIKLNPNNVTAHKNFGILQEKRGDEAQSEKDKLKLYEDAEKKYRIALKLDPEHPSAHRHLANLLAKLGRYEKAEHEYKEVKKIADNYPKNNRDFGIFLSKIGRKEEAKKELELAIKLFKEQGNEKEAEQVRELLKNL